MLHYPQQIKETMAPIAGDSDEQDRASRPYARSGGGGGGGACCDGARHRRRWQLRVNGASGSQEHDYVST